MTEGLILPDEEILHDIRSTMSDERVFRDILRKEHKYTANSLLAYPDSLKGCREAYLDLGYEPEHVKRVIMHAYESVFLNLPIREELYDTETVKELKKMRTEALLKKVACKKQMDSEPDAYVEEDDSNLI